MSPANLSTKRRWIAELARRKRAEALTSLHHLIDLEWMREAYELTRKDGATGIDGVTAEAYEANLEANLMGLLDRIKSGRYKAPPVRRTYIPKADGSQRPLGIPTFEDKVAQCCWSRSTSRTLSPAHMAFGPADAAMMRCVSCTESSRDKVSIGCSMSIYANTSTRSRIRSCERSSTSE
jgi:hypothetical protein